MFGFLFGKDSPKFMPKPRRNTRIQRIDFRVGFAQLQFDTYFFQVFLQVNSRRDINTFHHCQEGKMYKTRILFPVLFGLMITFGLLTGLAQASRAAAAPEAPSAIIVYVDKDAPGPTHDGLSWTTAYTTVQDALTVAISGTEIWVAEGVYYPDEGSGQTNDDRDSTYTLVEGVALYGGFAATETLRTQRDWEANVTVLSGDIDHETYPDITDPYGVVTNTDNIIGTNAYHVVLSQGVSSIAIIDGFSITAGQTVGNIYDTCIKRCGGGMYNDHSNPRINNLTFSGNSSEGVGGGMYNQNNSNPTLTNVVFSNNSADYGSGGMSNHESSPVLVSVTFSGNVSVYRGGGGMSNSIFSSPVLTNVIFIGNSANEDGGGMLNYWHSNPELTNVTFLENSAGEYGGGMDNLSSG
jgi:hypothetical protein